MKRTYFYYLEYYNDDINKYCYGIRDVDVKKVSLDLFAEGVVKQVMQDEFNNPTIKLISFNRV